MKAIDRIGLALVILVVANSSLLSSSSSSPSSSAGVVMVAAAASAETRYLRAPDRGIRDVGIGEEYPGTATEPILLAGETIAAVPPHNEERILGPKKKGSGGSSGGSGGGSSSSSSSSSSGGSSGGGGGGGSGDDDTTGGTGTTTSSDDVSSRIESTASASAVNNSAGTSVSKGFHWKDLKFGGTDRTAASVIVAAIGGLMCLSLLLFMLVIASHKILTGKPWNRNGGGGSGGDGILGDGNNKAEHLVSASLD